MALVMSVSAEDAFQLFCSENNFSFVDQDVENDTTGHWISFAKDIDETLRRYWDLKYSESYRLGNISTSLEESNPLENEWSDGLEQFKTFDPCIEKLTITVTTNYSHIFIQFKECHKYNRYGAQMETIKTPGVRYVGLFSLDSNSKHQ